MRKFKKLAFKYTATAVICALGVGFAELFVTLPGGVTPVWPPAGFSFAAILLFGMRLWPAVSVGIILGHMAFSPSPFLFILLSAISNTVAPMVAAWFLQRRRLPDVLTVRVRNGLALMQGGAVLALVSAFLGTTGWYLTSQTDWANYPSSWALWLLGDFFGVMVCAPPTVSVVKTVNRYLEGDHRVFHAPLPEFLLWLSGFGAVAVLAIWYANYSPYVLGLSYLPLALLLWSAMRFAPVYTYVSVMLSLMGLLSLAGSGISSFPEPKTVADTVVLMSFLIIMAMLPQLVAAANFERQYFASKLVYRANHDRLTGLRNRSAFEEVATSLLNEAVKTREKLALCYLDLDQFKVVNDTCGHMVGDNLIRQIAVVLEENMMPGDILARMGGDEFAALFRNCSREEANARAERMRHEVEEYRFVWKNRLFAFTVSIGLIELRPKISFTRQLSQADSGCYRAKEMGRNRIKLVTSGDEEMNRHNHEVEWAVRINEALEQGRFRLYCQPIQPSSGARRGYCHFEVLLRMIGEQGNVLTPGTFVPAAERFHLMTKVDRWVLKHTLSWLEAHPEALASVSICAINLSGPSLSDEGFHAFIKNLLHNSSVPHDKLCFEVTETTAIGDLHKANRFIKSMRSEGCHFALDDFGSGLASFGYLKTLQVDYLKIDGAFVRDIARTPIDLAMVKSINEVGHVMGKKTIAEYVENEEVRAMLEQLGVDFVQGYGIGRPQPIETFFGLEETKTLPN